MNEKEIILLNVTGSDRPGVTSALTGVLAQYNANILDIGQADIHKSLSLAILFEVNKGPASDPVLKDLLLKAYELDVTLHFSPVTPQEYEQWSGNRKKNRHIVNLLGRTISALQVSEVTKVLSERGLNIKSIRRLTYRPQLIQTPESRMCVELHITGDFDDRQTLTREFLDVSKRVGVDISFQEDNIYYRNRRLVCFDMDSTLIQAEVIDELAKRAGSGEMVAAITESAMRGEIDFKESFTKRLRTLKGLPESVLQEVAESLPLTDGCEKLIKSLKNYGYKTAIISGGFTYFGHYLKKKLGIDYVFANELEIINGKLTGAYVGKVVDGQRKAELLALLAEREHISTQQVVAVGDGANDLPMLNLAGLGIAFQAKPKVVENAKHSISVMGLDGVLYLLGYHDRHIEQNLRL